MGARIAGAAVLWLLLASCEATCGGAPVATAQHRQSAVSCVDVAAPHHAYVVVQHSSGAWIERCVGFAPGVIDVPTLMERAGIQYVAPESTMRAIDGEPSPGSSTSMRWVLFLAVDNRWTLTRAPFATLQVADAQAVGWRYVPAAESAPVPPPLPHELPG
jgi:hypothetical protein